MVALTPTRAAARSPRDFIGSASHGHRRFAMGRKRHSGSRAGHLERGLFTPCVKAKMNRYPPCDTVPGAPRRGQTPTRWSHAAPIAAGWFSPTIASRLSEPSSTLTFTRTVPAWMHCTFAGHRLSSITARGVTARLPSTLLAPIALVKVPVALAEGSALRTGAAQAASMRTPASNEP